MANANNITTGLREKGITISALADEMGVHVSTMSTVINGRSKSLRLQQAIADKLGSSVSELWPGQVRLRRSRAEVEAARNRHAGL